jgi:hypothetical protein
MPSSSIELDIWMTIFQNLVSLSLVQQGTLLVRKPIWWRWCHSIRASPPNSPTPLKPVQEKNFCPALVVAILAS